MGGLRPVVAPPLSRSHNPHPSQNPHMQGPHKSATLAQYLPRLGLRAMLSLFMLVAMFAGCLIGAVALATKMQAEDATERAFMAKDLMSDILPPPMYLVEMRLVIWQASAGAVSLPAARADFARLSAEHGARVAYWRAHPPTGLHPRLLDDLQFSALRVIESAGLVLDAINPVGDRTALHSAIHRVDQHYHEHRAAVDRAVRSVRALDLEASSRLRRTNSGMLWVLTAAVLGSLLVMAVVGWWIRRSVWAAVGGEPAEAARIAQAVAEGDVAVTVPVSTGDTHSIMAAMRRIHERAGSHDDLTGVFNRKGFEHLAQMALRGREGGGPPAALLMIDLDRFKEVNDGHGHAAGDAVLCAVTQLISTHTRGSDTVARLGGDEFAVVLPHCDARQAQQIADKLRLAIGAMVVDWGGGLLCVGASVGVAMLGPEVNSVAQWLALADAACYLNKRKEQIQRRFAGAEPRQAKPSQAAPKQAAPSEA